MKNNQTIAIEVKKVAQSKLPSVNFEKLDFGKVFTDHMMISHYKNGEWSVPKIQPYQKLEFAPSTSVFHYGQAVFEGMKAYKDEADDVWLFRPEENFKRINASCERLAMPEFPEEYFFEGLKTLLEIEKDWVQKGVGNSLYVRPFVIATEEGVKASPASEYMFIIICSPAQAYYGGEVRVKIAQKYSRAASGGFGYAKAAGNYAGQFYPTRLAQEKGYQQIIWTDANTHEYLEEAGTMNVFFRINDTLLTCPTGETILDGVTRKSVIDIAKTKGINVEIRPIKVQEIVNAAENGTLKEIFGSGTAAVISPISGFGYKDKDYELTPIENSYASLLKKKLLDIQYNLDEDTFGWRYKI
jgi:branched-chain amino acid aminotransferase